MLDFMDCHTYFTAQIRMRELESKLFARANEIRKIKTDSGSYAGSGGVESVTISADGNSVQIIVDDTHCSSCGPDSAAIDIPERLFSQGSDKEIATYFQTQLRLETEREVERQKLVYEKEQQDKRAQLARLKKELGEA